MSPLVVDPTASLELSIKDRETVPPSPTLQEEGLDAKVAEPCTLIIFGATGDLTSRKLLPALYNLMKEGQLPNHFACIGFARRDKSHELFRQEMHEALKRFSRTQPIEENLWNTFCNQIFYHISDFDNDAGYLSLKQLFSEIDQKSGGRTPVTANRLFYLATQPTYFPTIIEKLKKNGLIYDVNSKGKNWSRVIIEKPFGHDYPSALHLQDFVMNHLAEEQIYRIDHYLGKETVQNLLIFRFANSIFESFWNNHYIDHVQITAAEDIGIGNRGAFFEGEGIVRDIIQNHVMQLLSLVAMEPPTSLWADAIRDEKVKVLQAIRPIDIATLDNHAVRGQYGPGYIAGQPVVGYTQEAGVKPNSTVETFAAFEFYIDNWRWANVPFYLRAGKRLAKRATEISIVFKHVPEILFAKFQKSLHSNVLSIRIQPNEGIALKINCKVPSPRGAQSPVQTVKMDFSYSSYFGLSPPEAYERLICDAMLGDGTLFARSDEVLTSWKLFTPILEAWNKQAVKNFPNYAAGSLGPPEADQMLAKTQRSWKLV